MSQRKRLLWILVPVVACIALDQVTKAIAREQLQGQPPLLLVGGIVELFYGENTGAFLGLGSQLPASVRFWTLTVLTSAFMAGILIAALTAKRLTRLAAVAAGLIVGGGIGNLIDRVLYDGRVADFMRVGVGRLSTGVFNVADVAIMAGIGLAALWMLSEPTSDAEAHPTDIVPPSNKDLPGKDTP